MTDSIRQALQEGSDSLRAYYEKAGILVSRPAEGSSCPMAVSVKGGNNAENHNHNDIGSYAVALGKNTMAGDQGGPFSYPGDYFSAEAPTKYKIKGSFGHPVPVVDGKHNPPVPKRKLLYSGKNLQKKEICSVLTIHQLILPQSG
ncbi:hypothetical protein SFC43_19425 [Bacteroides sp. CR5/BHMF/2]|nr:hypothetical protein [Bacteroides sp. CR5/BHMF/2]